MSIKLTTAVIICFVAASITGIAFFITSIHYNRERYKHALYMSISWGNIMICYFLQGFSELFASKLLWLLCCYAYLPLGFSLVILLDSLTRITIDPIKIGIISALSTAVVITSFFPNSVIIIEFPNGELGMAADGPFLISQVLLYLVEGGLAVYYTFKILVNSPNQLKFSSRLFFLGAFTLGIIAPITVGVGLNMWVPASDALFVAIGTLLCSISIVRQPKLAYILPFKALKLTVVESEGGIPLFSHFWVPEDELGDEVLLSGFLSAISKGLDETLQRGKIREIVLDKGLLIYRKSKKYSISFVIVANKTSPQLRQGLKCFHTRYIEANSQFLSNPILNQDRLIESEKMIKDCFPFVPSYK
jgi:hypothetical protein